MQKRIGGLGNKQIGGEMKEPVFEICRMTPEEPQWLIFEPLGIRFPIGKGDWEKRLLDLWTELLAVPGAREVLEKYGMEQKPT